MILTITPQQLQYTLPTLSEDDHEEIRTHFGFPNVLDINLATCTPEIKRAGLGMLCDSDSQQQRHNSSFQSAEDEVRVEMARGLLKKNYGVNDFTLQNIILALIYSPDYGFYHGVRTFLCDDFLGYNKDELLLALRPDEAFDGINSRALVSMGQSEGAECEQKKQTQLLQCPVEKATLTMESMSGETTTFSFSVPLVFAKKEENITVKKVKPQLVASSAATVQLPIKKASEKKKQQKDYVEAVQPKVTVDGYILGSIQFFVSIQDENITLTDCRVVLEVSEKNQARMMMFWQAHHQFFQDCRRSYLNNEGKEFFAKEFFEVAEYLSREHFDSLFVRTEDFARNPQKLLTMLATFFDWRAKNVTSQALIRAIDNCGIGALKECQRNYERTVSNAMIYIGATQDSNEIIREIKDKEINAELVLYQQIFRNVKNSTLSFNDALIFLRVYQEFGQSAENNCEESFYLPLPTDTSVEQSFSRQFSVDERDFILGSSNLHHRHASALLDLRSTNPKESLNLAINIFFQVYSSTQHSILAENKEPYGRKIAEVFDDTIGTMLLANFNAGEFETTLKQAAGDEESSQEPMSEVEVWNGDSSPSESADSKDNNSQGEEPTLPSYDSLINNDVGTWWELAENTYEYVFLNTRDTLSLIERCYQTWKTEKTAASKAGLLIFFLLSSPFLLLSLIPVILDKMQFAVKHVTELPLLFVSIAAQKGSKHYFNKQQETDSIGWKGCYALTGSGLWIGHKLFSILFFTTRQIISPRRCIDEIYKHTKNTTIARIKAAVSLLVTLGLWTAIAGPLSVPLALSTVLPFLGGGVGGAITSALKMAANTVPTVLTHLLPQVQMATRLIASFALAAVLVLKNTISSCFSRKIPEEKMKVAVPDVISESSFSDISRVLRCCPTIRLPNVFSNEPYLPLFAARNGGGATRTAQTNSGAGLFDIRSPGEDSFAFLSSASEKTERTNVTCCWPFR